MPVVPNSSPPQNVAPATAGGPCTPWADEVPAECAGDHAPALIAQALQVATEALWALSGRRWGASCPVTIRPCLRALCGPPSRWERYHALPCDLPGHVLTLDGPVYQVDAVTIDGAPFAAWVVDDHRYLRRTDGEAWPLRQDLDLPDTEPGTFSVTWSPGLVPPEGGVWAVQDYACELLAARTTGRCKLPARTRTASAQGTTIEFDDVAEAIETGRTGLRNVDRWLAQVNPNRLAGRSSVMSPDTRPHRRR